MEPAKKESRDEYITRRLMQDHGVEKNIINKPPHYTRWKIEPITYIMRNGMEFWRGNIIKYASRAGFKDYPDADPVESEITDLRKVIRYAEMRINQLEGKVEL
jgi:hypothetical protein